MTNSKSHTDNTQSRPSPNRFPRSGVSRGTVFFLVALVGMMGFVAGTRSDELYSRVGQVFGIQVETGSLDLSSVQDVYRKLVSNYDGDIDRQALIDGASRGMVQAAGDEYTVFMDADEAKEFDRGLTGSISGIGAEIGVREDIPTVLRVIAGSPAEQAGVRAQDKIIRVNDKMTTRLDAGRTAELIRGEAGTTVSIEFLRDEETVKYSITRAQVSDASVDSRIDGDIGIIKLRRFDSDTAAQARQAAESMLSRGVEGVVLDMRDNGGGYLEQTPQVAGLWLDDKVVVTERRGEKPTEELRSRGAPILSDVPTIVLVNGSSASASEIVAGALQEHEAAVVLGEQTYGKGSVQQLLRLGSGRMLKVTVARWYTPEGVSISEKGIAPDVEVELSSDDYNQGNDPQLEAALKRLQED